MIGFINRNLKVYFKDKTAVFFSLLSVLIVIMLYVIFLGDVWIKGFEDIPEIENLMNSWVIAGIITISSVTTAMGAFGVMVEDKARKINKDFTVSPIKNSKIMTGYIISSAIIGIVMSIFTLIICQVYFYFVGGTMLELSEIGLVLIMIVLSTFASITMVLFIISFIKSQSAFATLSTIIGTLIGFITGVYLPIGSMTESVQWVIKLFPISHAAAIFRQIMTASSSEISFADVPPEFVTSFEESVGIIYKFGDHTVTTTDSILILLASTILFYLLSIINLNRKS